MKAEKFRNLLEYLSRVMMTIGILYFMIGTALGAMFGILAFAGITYPISLSLIGVVFRCIITGMIFTIGGWIASSILQQ